MNHYELQLKRRLGLIRDELRRLMIHQAVHARMTWPEPLAETFEWVCHWCGHRNRGTDSSLFCENCETPRGALEPNQGVPYVIVD